MSRLQKNKKNKNKQLHSIQWKCIWGHEFFVLGPENSSELARYHILLMTWLRKEHHQPKNHSGMGSANERRRYMVTSSPIGRPHTQNDWFLGMDSANERRRYMVTSSPIGRSHTQNDLCSHATSASCCVIAHPRKYAYHYCDVIMGAVASQITSFTIVYSTVYSDADQRKHQSCASLAFVRGIHRGPVNSPHKWPVTQKIFPFDDVIMWWPLRCVFCR